LIDTLKKNVLKEKRILRLINCLGEENFNDVEHFNTLPQVWQLIAKHLNNNGRKRPIIARNLWLWYHEEKEIRNTSFFHNYFMFSFSSTFKMAFNLFGTGRKLRSLGRLRSHAMRVILTAQNSLFYCSFVFLLLFFNTNSSKTIYFIFYFF
jgi:hypothetical protein